MLRCEVWPLLLGLRDANDTAVEQEQARRRRRERYRQLRRRCEELHEMLSGRSGAAMGASGDEPPADLGTFTETLPVIRADVPRTPFRTGAFQSHWEADRLAESASEDDLTNHSSTHRSTEPPADRPAEEATRTASYRGWSPSSPSRRRTNPRGAPRRPIG